jgi:hypothetical protein
MNTELQDLIDDYENGDISFDELISNVYDVGYENGYDDGYFATVEVE